MGQEEVERVDPESHEWGYVGRKFFAQKMWAATAAKPHLAEHMISLKNDPPRQAADTLSLYKTLEIAMAKLENPGASSN